jgi:uncharacterized protein YeeX (DUF496 family)
MTTSFKLDENIYVVENVLSFNTSNLLKEFAKDSDNWHVEQNRFRKRLSDNLEEQIKLELFPLFNCQIDAIGQIGTYLPNVLDHENISEQWSMWPHQDATDDYEPSKNIVQGLVYYINDDYEGGEIDYVNKNIIFKPKENSLVVHPSTKEYTHGVRLVTSGQKYIFTHFFRDTAVDLNL